MISARRNEFGKSLSSLYRHQAQMPLFDCLFARARLRVLPLGEIDRVIPKTGNMVEIGCGHGLITNYLAIASPERKVVGVDIDPRRIRMARTTINGRANVLFQEGRFSASLYSGLDVVILFGVLLLIPCEEWSPLFSEIHRALKPQGLLLLHDVLDDGSWKFRFHRAKEQLFKITGITRGEGFFVRKPAEMRSFLERSGFIIRPLGHEFDVPFHSCFTYLLTKREQNS